MAAEPNPPPPSPDANRQTLPCLFCGKGEMTLAFRSVEPEFGVYRCCGCGCGRTWPAPPPAEIGAWYPAEYYGKGNVRFNRLMELLVRWFRWRRARVMRRLAPTGRVLDVGCGRGLMLNYLRQLGYEPSGVELSETAAWHARHVLGLPVAVGDFLAIELEPMSLTAVIFWHSLEHFADPEAAVAKAAAALKPGGLLVVAVPNFASWQARLFGRRWFHLDVPRHYVHFTPEALRGLLGRHGLKCVKEDHFSLEQNPYGVLQSLLNAMGFRFNLLYTLLKDKSARQESLWRWPLQVSAQALLAPLLLPVSLAAFAVETVARSGGTFEVYARKN